jgi:hypothetical protein
MKTEQMLIIVSMGGTFVFVDFNVNASIIFLSG